MAVEEAWTTYTARLASFEVSVPVPTKKRTSNAKGTKAISWPHQSPSPAQLAQAGFLYRPSVESPDNTVCFMCDRQLDGWEEEDDPVAEHVKHSPQCGWAIMMSTARDTQESVSIEDPTESRLLEARKATFSAGWPHETKRGWTCKVDKMVQAGWYFAPTAESDDFVSCAYCKLSLDGWEPKDNPFDEHYRRSPDCSFFTFAGTTAPKAGRGRKPRDSKASRLSTQSNLTVASEAPSIPELDESIDTSTVSVLSNASNMGNKKNARGKGKVARPKKAKPVEESEPEASSITEAEEANGKPKPTRCKKRTSDQISEDDRGARESTVKPEPPTKRRDTKQRSSTAKQIEYPILVVQADFSADQDIPSNPATNGRKRMSSRSRKVSGASIASLRATIPDIAALDAALEAELDKPLSDEELPTTAEPEKPKRGRSKKATASTAPTRSNRQAAVEELVTTDGHCEEEQYEAVTVTQDEEIELTTKKGRKPRAVKKTARGQRTSMESNTTVETNFEAAGGTSVLTSHIIDDDSGHETDASVAGKTKAKKTSKRKVAAKGRGKKIGSGLMSKHIEDIVQPHPQLQAIDTLASAISPQHSLAAAVAADKFDIDTRIAGLNREIEEEDAATRETKLVKATKAKRPKSKISEKAPHLSMPGAFSPLMRDQSMEPSFVSVLSPDSPPINLTTVAQSSIQQVHEEIAIHPVQKDLSPTPTRRTAPPLPPRSPARSTPTAYGSAIPRPMPTAQRYAVHSPAQQKDAPNLPVSSPSAQSSDAENAPPSTRPEHTRPPLAQMSPNKITSVHLVPGTPLTKRVPLSPSKIGGGLTSQVPWTSVDVDMVFANTPGKEPVNVWAGTELTGHESDMTVEEWISANAAKAEEDLRREGERIVSVFEAQGHRAMGVLEGIECL